MLRRKTIDAVTDVCEFHINWPRFRDLIGPGLTENPALSGEQRACIFWMMRTMDRIGPADLAGGPHPDPASGTGMRIETTTYGGADGWRRN